MQRHTVQFQYSGYPACVLWSIEQCSRFLLVHVMTAKDYRKESSGWISSSVAAPRLRGAFVLYSKAATEQHVWVQTLEKSHKRNEWSCLWKLWAILYVSLPTVWWSVEGREETRGSKGASGHYLLETLEIESVFVYWLAETVGHKIYAG